MLPSDIPFYYTITSLRVDGDYSADPADYAHLSMDAPVGDGLYAYLEAHLSAKLTPKGFRRQPRPGVKALGMSWDMDNSFLLAPRPTRRVLEFWGRVSIVRMNCGGRLEAMIQGCPMTTPPRSPFDLQRILDDVRRGS